MVDFLGSRLVRRACTAVVASTVVLSLSMSAVAAHAEDSSLAGADLEAVLSEIAPEVMDDIANVEVNQDSVEFIENGVTTEVPLDSSRDITLSTDSADVSIGLPFGGQAEPTKTDADGVVAFDNGNDSKTAVIVHDDSSVQINTIIDGPEAPTRYDYPLTVPEGGNVTVDDSGSVVIADANGDYVAGVAKPWARDARGGEVSTRYEVNGTTLTQIVDHTSAGQYPVVADPWFGKALISRAVWAKNLWQYSPTLKVYPTKFGRNIAKAPPTARWSAWSETLSKAPRRGWPNPDTSSMRNQFYCHFDFVRVVDPFKPHWGLDSKIPDRGYWGFANRKNRCN